LDKAALEHDEIRERLTLDCEQLCAMIQANHNKLFVRTDDEDSPDSVQAHPIEKQHDYNLLLLHTKPGEHFPSAQRWRLRLGTHGIVQCENKKPHWPEPPQARRS